MALPLLAFGWAAWSRRWMSDDGYIYLRVVRQVLDGHGPVFNAGERVEATTSPAWLALLTVSKLALGPVSLPWIAVVLGLALAVSGLAFAQLGAYEMWRRRGQRIALPMGAVVVAALPPFWDFATSGLETGLAFAWLGLSFWRLSRRALASRQVTDRGLARSACLASLLGLGPLVRPDFAIYSLVFMLCLLALDGRGWRSAVALLAAAAALPFAYQVFRMGYYAQLAPNPAFAKEAWSSNWSQGAYYLIDVFRPYWLFVPFGLLGASVLPVLRKNVIDWRRATLVAAPVVGALLHALYVTRVGGDFMHARMLLPAIFVLLMPVAVISVDTALCLVSAAGIAVWAVVCAGALRPQYDAVGPHGVANERAYYISLAQKAHPITLRDYRRYPGQALAEIEEVQVSRGAVLLLSPSEQVVLRRDEGSRPVVKSASVGIFAYTMPTDVYVFDVYGVTDVFSARVRLDARGRPGHEKVLPEAWLVARYADLTAPLPPGSLSSDDVAAAHAALACGGLARLLDDVSGGLSLSRFAHSFADAFRLHTLRFASEPALAEGELC